MRPPTGVSNEVAALLSWADARARLGVRANADTPEDARRARELGAQGIGLCRTEHMFFQGERLSAMREMILADAPAARSAALQKLLPHQRRDFVGIFEAMAGRPVTIRLLDPPLHEFLPVDPADIDALAAELGISPERAAQRVEALREANPMLGHRGCRLAITYPEILDMQVTAIVEAALECRSKGIDARPAIMIPLVGIRRELAALRERAQRIMEKVDFSIPIGTMIEVPRAAVVADEIAREAEFFSFGTNDLTQMTFGFSRDDAGTFLPGYVEQGILARDPFVSIDVDGVGKLVRMAVALGRAARPSLDIGVCGEHGGDPDSIRFFDEAGLDYVSCSPLRVPVARLVAGQVAQQIESSHHG